MAGAGKTQTRTERESGLPQGYVVRLLGSSEKSKQILSPGPEVIRKLADYLDVSYEWLAIGRGPMHSDGWAPSAFEQALLVCQRARTRQDAIDAAVERHRGHEEMTAIDWILAVDTEARRLERLGLPRPEEIEAAQRTVKRLGKKKARLLREHAELQDARLERERKLAATESLPPAPAGAEPKLLPGAPKRRRAHS
ncbi:MAG: hypothetical protein QOG85_846 [Gaiellaceae bacterium]|jgi:hypothetical protein|nr:hypothetical protein [Gaiellaceae bacterium]